MKDFIDQSGQYPDIRAIYVFLACARLSDSRVRMY